VIANVSVPRNYFIKSRESPVDSTPRVRRPGECNTHPLQTEISNETEVSPLVNPEEQAPVFQLKPNFNRSNFKIGRSVDPSYFKNTISVEPLNTPDYVPTPGWGKRSHPDETSDQTSIINSANSKETKDMKKRIKKTFIGPEHYPTLKGIKSKLAHLKERKVSGTSYGTQVVLNCLKTLNKADEKEQRLKEISKQRPLKRVPAL